MPTYFVLKQKKHLNTNLDFFLNLSSGSGRLKVGSGTKIKWKTPFPGRLGNWSRPVRCPSTSSIFGFRVRSNHLWLTGVEFKCAIAPPFSKEGGGRQEVKTITLKIEDQPEYSSTLRPNGGTNISSFAFPNGKNGTRTFSSCTSGGALHLLLLTFLGWGGHHTELS